MQAVVSPKLSHAHPSGDQPGPWAHSSLATLEVYLSRGGFGSDEQTHSYTFALAPGAVTVDSALGKARIRAGLGSFGSISLTVTGRYTPPLCAAGP